VWALIRLCYQLRYTMHRAFLHGSVLAADEHNFACACGRQLHSCLLVGCLVLVLQITAGAGLVVNDSCISGRA